MFKKSLSIILIVCFFLTSLGYIPQAHADILGLPVPGSMVNLSPTFEPLLIKGLKVNPKNPLAIDFIVDTGNDVRAISNRPYLKDESDRLIKYFYAALTLPEADMWVNLSPYEKDRIIPESTGQTEIGRDMLAQDYVLKQITASLIYPEKGLGKDFWDRVYKESQQRFGTTEIPVNTFNKVWIVADKASVYENVDTVLVVNTHLKVMLEQDYLATAKNSVIASEAKQSNKIAASPLAPRNDTTSQIIREIILPALEREVNQGKNFANLRQIFHSLVLAKWYKETLKTAFLNQVYSNKSKVTGVDVTDKTIKEKIYQQYLQAYKKGVFNYIKEDIDQTTQQRMPKKYFSGGMELLKGLAFDRQMASSAKLTSSKFKGSTFLIGSLATTAQRSDKTMTIDSVDLHQQKLKNLNTIRKMFRETLHYPLEEIDLGEDYAFGKDPIEVLKQLMDRGFNKQQAQWFLDTFVLCLTHGLNAADARYLLGQEPGTNEVAGRGLSNINPFLIHVSGGTVKDGARMSSINLTASRLWDNWLALGINDVPDTSMTVSNKFIVKLGNTEYEGVRAAKSIVGIMRAMIVDLDQFLANPQMEKNVSKRAGRLFYMEIQLPKASKKSETFNNLDIFSDFEMEYGMHGLIEYKHMLKEFTRSKLIFTESITLNKSQTDQDGYNRLLQRVKDFKRILNRDIGRIEKAIKDRSMTVELNPGVPLGTNTPAVNADTQMNAREILNSKRGRTLVYSSLGAAVVTGWFMFGGSTTWNQKREEWLIKRAEETTGAHALHEMIILYRDEPRIMAKVWANPNLAPEDKRRAVYADDSSTWRQIIRNTKLSLEEYSALLERAKENFDLNALNALINNPGAPSVIRNQARTAYKNIQQTLSGQGLFSRVIIQTSIFHEQDGSTNLYRRVGGEANLWYRVDTNTHMRVYAPSNFNPILPEEVITEADKQKYPGEDLKKYKDPTTGNIILYRKDEKRNWVPVSTNAPAMNTNGVSHASYDTWGNPVNGGIDLNASKIDMQKSGQAVQVEFSAEDGSASGGDRALVAQFEQGNFAGIKPVITSVTQIFTVLPLFGFKNEPPANVKLARV